MSNTLAPITGIEEVQQMLRGLPRAIVAKSFVQGFRAAREVIESELLSRTPERAVDESARPEDQVPLRESIVGVIHLDSDLRGGTLNVGFGKQGNIANFVEYGHRMLTHSKKEVGQVPAYPFMRPTADTAADPATEAFTDAMYEGLKGDIYG